MLFRFCGKLECEIKIQVWIKNKVMKDRAMKKYNDVKEWIEEVETVLTNFKKDKGINLTAEIFSEGNINKWVEWKEDNRKDADVIFYDFVKDTIKDEKTEYPEDVKDTIEDEESLYSEDAYKKWMLYRAGELLIKDEKNIKLKKDISEKFVEIRKYFVAGKHDQEKEIIMKLHDPDGNIKDGKILGGSQLLQYIYKKLWPELTAQEFMKHLLIDNQKTWICSDTMTSAQRRMNDFLKDIETKDDHGNIFQTIKNEIGNINYSQKLCIELYFRGCLNPENENFLGKTFKETICDIAGGEAERQLCRFLECWHMLGNYCPVPRHFNSARSAYAVYDYWDLTLLKIQEYYKNRDREDEVWKILGEELLHGSGNALACKLWLDYFGSWENFIEKNYMQDFVKKENSEDDYKVRLFFDGHSWNEPTPKGSEEFINLFKNASEMIEKRTLRIIDALRDKIINGKNEN